MKCEQILKFKDNAKSNFYFIFRIKIYTFPAFLKKMQPISATFQVRSTVVYRTCKLVASNTKSMNYFLHLGCCICHTLFSNGSFLTADKIFRLVSTGSHFPVSHVRVTMYSLYPVSLFPCTSNYVFPVSCFPVSMYLCISVYPVSLFPM